LYLLGCAYCAPPQWGPAWGLLVGATYFIFCWLLAGLYLADVLHLGIAHRSLDYQEWFIKAVTVTNNTFGLYVDPIGWVNRHRLHHKHSDHPGDPNKLSADGFWRTLYLCIVPYDCIENVAKDRILQAVSMRFVASTAYAVFSQFFSFALLWLITRDLRFTAVMWLGMRIFALWVNMIQNYWTHTRSYGYRRYDDDHDNAMNIGEWLPVTATFSACFQNNHHHFPTLLRLTHDTAEYDFGFATIRLLRRLGVVKATARGAAIPAGVRAGVSPF
jgi:stearoyl-CoA desaturase (delta-9 desaturase)